MPDTKKRILQEARDFVYRELKDDSSGHDWWHIVRVANNAVAIAEKEGADLFICELAALLHDIADGKLNESEKAGLQKVEQWLISHKVSKSDRNHILDIISKMSFKGGQSEAIVSSIEGKIVQDADRLDAIGAIAIARTFVYSGVHQRPIYTGEPLDVLEKAHDLEDTAILHFYEKLLTLSDTLHTPEAREIAKGRHEFIKEYLTQFFAEWEGLK